MAKWAGKVSSRAAAEIVVLLLWAELLLSLFLKRILFPTTYSNSSAIIQLSDVACFFWIYDFRNNAINERPQMWSGLIVNSCLEAMAIALTKLKVLGVKLYVNGVEKVNFKVNIKKYSLKSQIHFETNCCLQATTADRSSKSYLLDLKRAAISNDRCW